MKPDSSRFRPSRFAAALFVLLFLPACIIVVEKDDDDKEYDLLYGTRWRLEVIVYDRSSYTADDGVYRLSFSDGGSLSGQADCKTFEGRYQVGRDYLLEIQRLSSSTLVCSEPTLSSLFLDGLADAARYENEGATLRIELGGRGNYMLFSKD